MGNIWRKTWLPMTNVERRKWDWRNVRDFDWLSNSLKEELFPEFEGGDQLCVNTGVSWDWNKLKTQNCRIR